VIGARSRRRRGKAVTPVTIFGASLLQWVRADLGVTVDGSDNVSAWADQSGNGHDYAQATAGSRPAFSATGGPDGKPTITGDGSADWLENTTLDLPAPATTATSVILVCAALTWTNNDTIICSPGGFNIAMGLYQIGTTPGVTMWNNANGNAGSLTLLAWRRVLMIYRGGTADVLKIGSAADVTGTSAGNENPAQGRILFARATGANPANISIAEAIHVQGVISAQQRTDIDDYITARYGAGLV
jgi:hypothetical protein